MTEGDPFSRGTLFRGGPFFEGDPFSRGTLFRGGPFFASCVLRLFLRNATWLCGVKLGVGWWDGASAAAGVICLFVYYYRVQIK